MTEQTYTVIGTAKNPQGVIKVRWTNDLITHYKRVNRKGCTDINFFNLPQPMTKLDSINWVLSNKELNEEQQEIFYIKKAEKTRQNRLMKTKLVKEGII